jgi:hypothetical protein
VNEGDPSPKKKQLENEEQQKKTTLQTKKGCAPENGSESHRYKLDSHGASGAREEKGEEERKTR